MAVNSIDREIGREWYLSVGIALMVAIAVGSYLLWGKFDGNITGFFRIG